MVENEAGMGTRKNQFVMVVDGNSRDLLSTGMMLQNFGYTVTTVKSGEEAQDLISVAVPSLVVMELVLPGRDGYSLLGHIRNEANLTKLPVIVQTSLPDIKVETECREAGCTLYLRKPVRPEDLYRAIQSTLEPTPRASLRITTYLHVSVGDAQLGKELITALSDGGVFIKTLQPRAVGTRHAVSFMVSGRVVQVEAAVLYVYKFGEGPNKEPGMGMQFSRIDPADREFLREFIRAQVTPSLGAG